MSYSPFHMFVKKTYASGKNEEGDKLCNFEIDLQNVVPIPHITIHIYLSY